jgi:hypothetical protein
VTELLLVTELHTTILMCYNKKKAQKRVLYEGMLFNCQLRP